MTVTLTIMCLNGRFTSGKILTCTIGNGFIARTQQAKAMGGAIPPIKEDNLS